MGFRDHALYNVCWIKISVNAVSIIFASKQGSYQNFRSLYSYPLGKCSKGSAFVLHVRDKQQEGRGCLAQLFKYIRAIFANEAAKLLCNAKLLKCLI